MTMTFYELECALKEFVEEKGFKVHESIYTAPYVDGVYLFKLRISHLVQFCTQEATKNK